MTMKTPLRAAMMLGALALAGCASAPMPQETTLDPDRMSFAMSEVEDLQSRGARVWCVPFARNLSGVEIHGNARTWWKQAQADFPVSHAPELGAVMAFAPTSAMPLGHVGVVSAVEGDRKIRIDHANWHRNEVSLNMSVIDVSKNNDWSRVRVETYPGAYGSVYPINGFILPDSPTQALATRLKERLSED